MRDIRAGSWAWGDARMERVHSRSLPACKGCQHSGCAQAVRAKGAPPKPGKPFTKGKGLIAAALRRRCGRRTPPMLGKPFI